MDDEERNGSGLGFGGDFVDDSLESPDGLVVVVVESLDWGVSKKSVPPNFAVFESVAEVEIGDVEDSRDRVVRHRLSGELGPAEGRSLEGILSREAIPGPFDLEGLESSNSAEVDSGGTVFREIGRKLEMPPRAELICSGSTDFSGRLRRCAARRQKSVRSGLISVPGAGI